MPAVVRGAPAGAKPRAKASAKPAGGKPRRGPAPYAPGKIGASHGISPKVAFSAAAIVVAAGLVVTFATGGRGQALVGAASRSLDARVAGLGFKVKQVRLEGVSAPAEADVRRALGDVDKSSILALDLNQIRAQVEQVGWVKSARVIRLLPDTLLIRAVERPRLAVWQRQGVVNVVDADGRVIPEAAAGQFTDLPLVVGDGANVAAGATLPLLESRPHLMQQIEALVRVDGRRWDLRLRDGSLIQLPAEHEDQALIELDQMEREQRILELGFARVDLRVPDAPAVRPRGKDEVAPGGLAPTGGGIG